MELSCFLSEPTKKISLQNEEKTKGRKWDCLMDENTHVHLHIAYANFFFSFPLLGTLHLPFFFLLFLSWAHCLCQFFLSFPFLGRLPFLIFFFFSFPRLCLLPSFFFFFWIYWAIGVIVVLFYFVFCLTRQDFYFLINLMQW